MVYLRRTILGILRVVNRVIPESSWKNRLRARALEARNALPRELMVQSGDTVLQVGMWRRANLARLSRCVGPAGRVILVEADGRVAAELQSFAAEKKLDNLTIVPKGAFNRKGRQTLRVGTSPTHNRVDGTEVSMVHEEFESTTEIEIDTVDNILSELGVTGIDHAEITVNGVELQVLEGMEETLPHTKRLFLAGYALALDTDEPTNRKTERLLRERGFETTVSKRTSPDSIKSAVLPTGPEQPRLQGHVFAWQPARTPR